MQVLLVVVAKSFLWAVAVACVVAAFGLLAKLAAASVALGVYSVASRIRPGRCLAVRQFGKLGLGRSGWSSGSGGSGWFG